VSTWVPEQAVPVEQLREYLELTPGQMKVLTRVHGLREVRTSGDGMVLEGLLRAALPALGRLGDPDRVRFVLHAHTLQDIAPSTVTVVHDLCDALRLSRATSFSVTQQNCASGLLALDVARRLLDGEAPDAVALVVTGEKPFTPLAQLIPNTTIMGEAFAACVVAPGDGRDRIVSYASRTIGRYSSGLELDPGSLREFEQEYTERLADVILDAAARAGIGLHEVALLLPHNVNRSSWLRLARRLELPAERLYLDNVARLGHCYCADPFLNYESACSEGRLEPGDYYLMAAVGLGATFTAVVLRH
jgi:3-oxoacyl-[acyl-carrier-protein] synthase-3